jgi:hypothetical protein
MSDEGCCDDGSLLVPVLIGIRRYLEFANLHPADDAVAKSFSSRFSGRADTYD